MTAEKKKMEHLFVIYAVNGEHFTIECDDIRRGKEELWLYSVEKNSNDEEEREMIAAFELKNIIGWEQIR